MAKDSTQIQIRAVSAPWYRGVELLIRQGRDVGVNVVMEPAEDGQPVDPTITIPIEAAQTLMDDLWHAGLRPTEGTGSAGAMRATEAHLADLRKITFAVLKISG